MDSKVNYTDISQMVYYGMTPEDISDKTGMNVSDVYRKLDSYGLSYSKDQDILKNQTWVRNRIVFGKMGINEMARELNCSRQLVTYWVKQHGYYEMAKKNREDFEKARLDDSDPAVKQRIYRMLDVGYSEELIAQKVRKSPNTIRYFKRTRPSSTREPLYPILYARIKAGLPVEVIAWELGVPNERIFRWCEKYDLPMPKPMKKRFRDENGYFVRVEARIYWYADEEGLDIPHIAGLIGVPAKVVEYYLDLKPQEDLYYDI